MKNYITIAILCTMIAAECHASFRERFREYLNNLDANIINSLYLTVPENSDEVVKIDVEMLQDEMESSEIEGSDSNVVEGSDTEMMMAGEMEGFESDMLDEPINETEDSMIGHKESDEDTQTTYEDHPSEDSIIVIPRILECDSWLGAECEDFDDESVKYFPGNLTYVEYDADLTSDTLDMMEIEMESMTDIDSDEEQYGCFGGEVCYSYCFKYVILPDISPACCYYCLNFPILSYVNDTTYQCLCKYII